MNEAGQLIGKPIHSLDGEIGSVQDLYFDDRTWQVRYLVVDTGKWLSGKRVLLAPEAIVKPWHQQPSIDVKLTTEQILSSPDIDSELPMSRAVEEAMHLHYQWTPYWGTMAPAPPVEDGPETVLAAESLVHEKLQSADELAGFHVVAGDGEVGAVQDLLLDDNLDRFLFLVVEVKGWLFGKKVLVGPSLISKVDWSAFTVQLNANRQALKTAQEYEPAA